MKTRRIILYTTFFITLLSIILVIFTKNNSKQFQIALALMGSSFISFILELPNYIELKANNRKNLYFYLHEIKLNIHIIQNTIERSNYYDVLPDKFCEEIINKLRFGINQLYYFDSNYYLSKTKNIIIANSLSSLRDSINNLNSSLLSYPIEYYKKKIIVIEQEKNERLLKPFEMVNSLQLINNMCATSIEALESNSKILLNKKELKQWAIDDIMLKNINNSIKLK